MILPGALRVFRGSFISQLMAHKAMMAKERRGTDGARPLYISEGPLERFCALLLQLMGRLTALNLTIPSIPQLPSFQELKHMELHSSEYPILIAISTPQCMHESQTLALSLYCADLLL